MALRSLAFSLLVVDGFRVVEEWFGLVWYGLVWFGMVLMGV